ncbi:recombinase family protein [Vibrio parahaemolyticus]|uniref:recombinase family protein n=1 Tax=Vibrio parahaemolyticus TaxID=670 RepID=UPI001D1BBDC9|nr:recombinase family protein [Vibrio parahaemolyticus]EJG1954160.1 recombinase family protein [Vibrio parahaemolyticus]MCF9520616.1 recombinase family protein [Vibrio parahaemolyticus]MCF9565462.1 recombinase family protein [Vibrio parahaemolyticus]MCF9597523.1 recombinase family protein [Vibrio parahaemolyticus]
MFNFDKSKYKGICVPYARFSTDVQDEIGRKSLERQMEEAKRFSDEYGLFFDEDIAFVDRGVSGFALSGDTAKTFQKGQMQLMLELLEEIDVAEREFIYITFHNFDRFSRMSPDVASRYFEQILDKGFNIVTTIDNEVYRRNSGNLEQMIISIIHMSTAYYESEVKSIYISDSRQRKRDIIEYLYNDETQKGKHRHVGIKACCPRWIKTKDIIYEYVGKDGSVKKEALKRFEIDEERSKIINYIFDLKIQGLGNGKICQVLNEQNIPVFHSGNYTKAKYWNLSTISNYLKNENVIGHSYLYHKAKEEVFNEKTQTFSTKRVRKIATDKLYNYYPAIMSEEKFNQAKEAVKANSVKVDRSKVSEKPHMFSNLMRCSCGTRLHYKLTKKNNVKKVDDYFEYLKCERSALNDSCTGENINYKNFEAQFINFIRYIDVNEILDHANDVEAETEGLTELQEREAAINLKITGLTKTYQSLINAGVDGSDVLVELEKAKGELQEVEFEKSKLLNSMKSQTSSSSESIKQKKSALKSKVFAEKVEARRAVNELLKQKIRWMEVYATAYAKFVIVCFVDNVIRTYAYQDEFATDLMFNTIKINTDGLKGYEADELMVLMIKTVRESLAGMNEVITNTDLKIKLAAIKSEYMNK